VRFGSCTLCGAGCGLQARTCGAAVYGLAPSRGGALCPAVYGAHQLPYHAGRLRSGIVRGKDVKAEEALKAAIAAIREAGQRVAFVDERPGRTLTLMARRVFAHVGGRVVAAPQAEDGTLAAIESMAGLETGTLGYDFENVGVVLSLGAPLLDGWGVPDRLPRLWSTRREKTSPMFLHAGGRLSPSALLSDSHHLIHPGSEAALAAGLAGALVRAGLARESGSNFAKAAAAITLEEASARTGLAAKEVDRIAQLLATGPAIVIGGGDPVAGCMDAAGERVVAGLNVMLGSLGRAGGIVPRHAAPVPDGEAPARVSRLEEVEDGSIAVLVHDASTPAVALPDALLRRKLAAGGTLVRLTAYRPEADSAPDIAVPATAFLEALDDAAGPREARVASWSVAPALLAPPAGVFSTVQFLAQLGAEAGIDAGSLDDLMKRKAEAIVRACRGSVRGRDGSIGGPAPTDAAALLKEIQEGAAWVDDPAPLRPVQARLDQATLEVVARPHTGLMLVATGWRGSAGTVPAAPLSTKVELEMRLRPVAGEARIHPETAAGLGLADGCVAAIETEYGSMRARVRIEKLSAPGVVEVAACGTQRQSVLKLAGAADPRAGGAVAVRVRRV
jgi:anaerobic selenocysteine-containing dehydrogenase